jgi:hypothetical protein
LPDLSFTAPPPRPELLRETRLALLDAQPGLRIVAQGLLGAQAPIDFVAIEAEGRLVLVLVADDDQDLELLARGLAQRAWVAPRIADWLQLAPDLGVRQRAGIRLVLLAARFRPETEAAAQALGEDAPELWIYRCVRNGSGVAVLVEPPHTQLAAPPAADELGPEPAQAPGQASGFRTGLSEADLGLTPAERREFE